MLIRDSVRARSISYTLSCVSKASVATVNPTILPQDGDSQVKVIQPVVTFSSSEGKDDLELTTAWKPS